ncbi:nuclear transport factor 2 family protein [Nisaea denitrificans]|uniref:nuclear transport factor 2 family protein n=1 Tax=Nisaea denitrificans TaxID=390877 RepID=UPI0004084057|nr:nuclear transport factor 2 family protein [Nisaea denitrificans]
MSRARQAEILMRNEAFYTAFTTRDLAAMESLWASEMHVSCIHPGGTPLFGREAVIESWVRILSSPVRSSLECLEPKAHFLSEDLALVVCFERHGNETLTATNIFAFESADWVLIHHQSGPVASEVSARADIPAPRLLQ